MPLPLTYHIRSVLSRKITAAMTAFSIAVAVTVLLAALALTTGLRQLLAASGQAHNVLVMRRGASSEVVSNFARALFNELRLKPGIAAGPDGQPLASLEIVSHVVLPAPGETLGAAVTVRGLMPPGIVIRAADVTVGRWFEPGRRELVVGRAIAEQFPAVAPPATLRFGGGDWQVVGVFAAAGAQNSEIWGDLNQIAPELQRGDVPSSARLQAATSEAAAALVADINADARLELGAISEQAFYTAQSSAAIPVQYASLFIAAILAVGSSFAAMNTMYAAISRRRREISTLRVLGFSPANILTGFMVESLAMALAGAALASALVLPLTSFTTALGNANYSQTTFRFAVTPGVLAIGLAFSLFIGLAGGLLPARYASSRSILDGLKA